MDTIVPSLVIALVLWWLAVRLYNDWLFLSRPRLNALGTIIGYSRINDDGGQLSPPIIRFVGSYSPSRAYGLFVVVLAVLVAFVTVAR